MPELTRCDICIYRDHAKDGSPCNICTDNKLHISRFKPDPIVELLKEHWGIKDDIAGLSKEETNA